MSTRGELQPPGLTGDNNHYCYEYFDCGHDDSADDTFVDDDDYGDTLSKEKKRLDSNYLWRQCTMAQALWNLELRIFYLCSHFLGYELFQIGNI